MSAPFCKKNGERFGRAATVETPYIHPNMKIDRKIGVALGVAFVYFSTFHPSDWVRTAAEAMTGSHAYEGVWIFIPHLLFYSTFTAMLAGACWIALARAGLMDHPPLQISKAVVVWGLMGGTTSVLAGLAFLYAAGMGEFGWVGFDGWTIAGNVFSNFFEEFIYRGFLLAGLAILVGFWPAAILTSLAFGFSHEQYPLVLQLFITVTSLVWCRIVRQSRSIWAVWGAHMIVDIAIDAIWA